MHLATALACRLSMCFRETLSNSTASAGRYRGRLDIETAHTLGTALLTIEALAEEAVLAHELSHGG